MRSSHYRFASPLLHIFHNTAVAGGTDTVVATVAYQAFGRHLHLSIQRCRRVRRSIQRVDVYT